MVFDLLPFDKAQEEHQIQILERKPVLDPTEIGRGAQSQKEVDRIQRLIIFALNSEVGLSRMKSQSVGAHFDSLEEFLGANPDQLRDLRSVSGKKIRLLNAQQIASVVAFQKSNVLSSDRTASENLIKLITRDFVKKQIRMLDDLTLEKLSPNPFLIKCLNLSTASEIIDFNVYMFAARSIVTSMGFFIEKLLLASSDSANLATNPWDLLKTKTNKQKSWIQLKSGPNDMDADQIRHWADNIAEKIKDGDEAFIGTAYGRRESSSVTMGLFRTYLPDWEKRTLIGRELWKFVSEDLAYHEKLFPLLVEAAAETLGTDSIEQRIQRAVERITQQFTSKYGDEAVAVDLYISDLF